MIQRGDSFLHAHARGGAEGRYYRRCDTCNHLHDELQGFFLTHNGLIVSLVRLASPRMFNGQCSMMNGGACAPTINLRLARGCRHPGCRRCSDRCHRCYRCRWCCRSQGPRCRRCRHWLRASVRCRPRQGR